MLTRRDTLIDRSNGPLALVSVVLLLTCTPEDASTPEPQRGRQTDDAAEWAAARRSGDAETADGEPLDDDALAAEGAAKEPFPCTVIAQAEVEELLGNAVEPPAWTLEEVEEEGAAFSAETCSWLTFAEGASEITLQVSRAEHFPNAEVVCWSPVEADAPDPTGRTDESDAAARSGAEVDEDLPGEPSPVAIAGLGSTAWWLYDSVTAFGSLQVCHPRARIGVEINAGDSGVARRSAVTLARRAIGALGDGG